MPRSSLDKLVDDILIRILQTLSVDAVLSLRRASRRYYTLSRLRCVWYTHFCTEVLTHNLPLPGPPLPLSLLSATELERRTLRALYLDDAWPCLSAKTLASRRHDTSVRVDQVVFIPGGTELLTVQGDKVTHWLIISWQGFTQGLKHVAEWTPLEGVPCRVFKDVEVPGVVAVGPRESLSSRRFAKVVSTSLKTPFVTLCDYAHVSGAVVGIWRHLLLLDTTRVFDGGCLELLDWRARTTGMALLQQLPDVFGKFLDFVVFAGHLLIIWEHCVSVFPVPHVPAAGQVFVEHKRVFMFQEAVSRPVGFTTCVARRVMPLHPDATAKLGQNADQDWNGHALSILGTPTLTIVARSRRQPESMSMVMLVPLVDEEDCEKRMAVDSTFPYRLTYLPPHLPAPWAFDNKEVHDPIPRACTALCLGSSGRGVFVVGRELRLASPGLLILPPYEMQFGPVFETGKALYHLDWHRKAHLNEITNIGNDAGEDSVNLNGYKVDFDEGMGRFVVANECGGFEVVQLH